MLTEEMKLAVLKQKELSTLKELNKNLFSIKMLLIILLASLFMLTFILRIAIYSAENKTDMRYFDLKEATAITHNIWVDERTGMTFKNKAEYQAYKANQPRYKRKNIFQKSFLFFAK